MEGEVCDKMYMEGKDRRVLELKKKEMTLQESNLLHVDLWSTRWRSGYLDLALHVHLRLLQ